MPQCFAQLSDPHLSTLENVRPRDLLNKRALGYLSWRRKRRFEHRPEVLAALQRDLPLAGLDQLLVTGDLTHIGLPQEFAQSRDWLHQLGEPAHIAVIPGNHDACVAAPWETTFGLWQQYMAGDSGSSGEINYPTRRVRGDIAFIGLSTGCPKPPLMATGTLGATQLAAIGPMLDEARRDGLFRVVYLHHSPLAGVEKWRKRLTDAADIQALLQQHGAELVVHGHGHRAHYSELQTQHGTAPVIAVPSGSALGLHGADVACYNRYEVERTAQGWLLRIHTRRYCPESDAFLAGESRELVLDRPV